MHWLAYEFTAKFLTLALTLGWSFRVHGRRNLPAKGPVLIIANHQSFLDPPAIGAACNRHIVYLARKTLFNNPAFSFLIRTLKAIPIDQEGIAKDGIRGILAKLEEGWPVLVFPEGSRCDDGSMLPLAPGISLLIKRVRCPIVPVGIAGAFASWSRFRKLPVPSPLFLPATDRTIAVAIGRPRDPETVAHLPREEMLRVLAADIQAAFDQAEAIRRKPSRAVHRVDPRRLPAGG